MKLTPFPVALTLQVYPSSCVGSVLHLDAQFIQPKLPDDQTNLWYDASPMGNTHEVYNLEPGGLEGGAVKFRANMSTYAHRPSPLQGLNSSSQLTFSMTVMPEDVLSLKSVWYALGRPSLASEPTFPYHDELVFQGGFFF